jgi:D-alanyl-D-alanine carboxypeptidase
VKEDGRVELSVPFPAGAHLIVFVIQADDAFDDLLMAAESSLDFWDNPWDDEDKCWLTPPRSPASAASCAGPSVAGRSSRAG